MLDCGAKQSKELLSCLLVRLDKIIQFSSPVQYLQTPTATDFNLHGVIVIKLIN